MCVVNMRPRVCRQPPQTNDRVLAASRHMSGVHTSACQYGALRSCFIAECVTCVEELHSLDYACMVGRKSTWPPYPWQANASSKVNFERHIQSMSSFVACTTDLLHKNCCL